jgi:N-acetyltransferase
MMHPDLWFSLPVLTGRLVRLEPLSLEHAAGYLKAAGTGTEAQEVFRWLAGPTGATAAPVTVAEAVRQIAGLLADRARGGQLSYAMIDVGSGRLAGVTGFAEIDPAARRIAVGQSWLGSRWWRGNCEAEASLLMLTYAFDALGAVRVSWQLDAGNSRTAAALQALGVSREGVLRKHRLVAEGSWHDSVQFAMTDEDWPRVRGPLTQRLGP